MVFIVMVFDSSIKKLGNDVPGLCSFLHRIIIINQIMIQRNKVSNLSKSKKGLNSNKNIDKKSYNLKELHRTFYDQYPKNIRSLHQASAAQILMNNREGVVSPHNAENKKQEKQEKTKLTKYYMNVDKIRNLNVSNREKNKLNYQSSYFKNDDKLNRRSLILKKYEKSRKNLLLSLQYKRKLNRSSEHDSSENIMKKRKGRYKTENQEKINISRPIIVKKSIFRREKPKQIRDKTFIDGYLKGKQLGRGGFSQVWQGFNFQNKEFYAIKQIKTTNKFKTHLTQIKFGEYFFEKGQPREQFKSHPGVKHLLTMYEYSIMDPRAFIVYENCEGSLGGLLYDIYEEDESEKDENEQIYYIKYHKLYGQLRKQTNFLKCLIYEVCLSLDLLQKNRIVHSDIKTQNILLKKTSQNNYIFKLIDYGSSFVFKNLNQYKLATPQYMCPQLLNYILFENGKQYNTEMLRCIKNYKNISAIDMWGLGSILLQLIHGIPLWLTNPTKLMVDKKQQIKKGLFAVSNRSFTKILERQMYVVQNLDDFIQFNNNSRILIDESIKRILKGILNPDPEERLRPRQVIEILKN